MNLAAPAAILLFAMMGQYEAPGVASTAPNPDYPLHIRVLSNQRTHNRFGYHGFGRADLLGPTIRGMDYTFDCERGFMHNEHRDEFYQGRWKKPDQKMEILIQKVGSDHVEKCTLEVTLKDAPYGRYRNQPAGAPPPPPQ